MPKLRFPTVLFVCLVVLATLAAAAGALDSAAVLPLDPSVRTGRLSNGVTYFVKANLHPEGPPGIAELRLAVDVGSVVEQEDQRGYAHFVEHLAFRATARFPEGEIRRFLESAGMQSGQDVNGVTGFDRTLYRLRLPTSDVETLQRGIQLLEDWAHGIRFTPEVVERERGVVLAEYRQRQRGQMQLHERHLPVLLQGSLYAERMPLGRLEIIQQATPERLQAFYETWYRPGRIMVVAIGDFDEDLVIREIRQRFAFADRDRPVVQAPVPAVPMNEKTLFASGSDSGAKLGVVSLAAKYAPAGMRTVSDYRHHLVRLLYQRILSARIDAAADVEDPPFLAAVATDVSLARRVRAMHLSALAPVEALPRAFEGLLVEIERLRRRGLAQGELDREKAALLQAMETAAKEPSPSEEIAEECIDHHLEGEPMPGIAFEIEAARQLLPGISDRDFDGLTRRWVEEIGRVVLITVPEGRSGEAPSEEALASRLAAARALELPATPAATAVKPAPPTPLAPPAAEVLRRSEIPRLALTEWELANGARVVLKTLPGAGTLLMNASSAGGYSLVPDEDHAAALVTGSVVAGLGFGDLEADKDVELSVVLGEVAETVRGSAPTQRLDALLRRVHQAFGPPRRDEKAFAAVLAVLEERLVNRRGDPARRLDETAQRILTRDHPRARRLTVEPLRAVDLDTVLGIYRDRFDAGDFTFVFVGDVQAAELEPLVRSYIGSLPSRSPGRGPGPGRRETWRDLGIAPVPGIVRERIAFGQEADSRIQVVFHHAFEYSPENVRLLSALALVMQRRLETLLRDSRGETYGMDVGVVTERPPRSRCRLEIGLRGAVGREDRALAAILEVAEALRREPVGDAELANLRQNLARQEEEPRTAEVWLRDLTPVYLYGGDPLDLLRRTEPRIDAETLLQAARTWLDPGNRLELILTPEEPPAGR